MPTPVSQTATVNSETQSVKTKEPEMKDLPDIVLVPPTDAGHLHSDVLGDQINGNGIKASGNGQSGRESVWQKLSNRIKVYIKSLHNFVGSNY